MSRISFRLALAALCLGCLSFAGCQTMRGLGEDISSGGKALTRAAEGGEERATVNN